MAKYTNQQIIDRVRQVFVHERNKPSVDEESGFCFYDRRKNGVGCAIGCLIPDEVGKKWDGCEITDIVEFAESSYLEFFDLDQLEFLKQIQEAHDNNSSKSKIDEDFANIMDFETRAIAVEFGLNIN